MYNFEIHCGGGIIKIGLRDVDGLCRNQHKPSNAEKLVMPKGIEKRNIFITFFRIN